MKKSFPILIAGMHRSGTSLVAQLLHSSGLFIGDSEKIASYSPDDNPTGYWESKSVYVFSDEIIKLAGMTWDSITPSLVANLDFSAPEWEKKRHEALELFSGYQKNSNCWGWKDPRNSILVPFWKEIFPDLRVVICLRNPLETAFSLSKRIDGHVNMNSAISLWKAYYQTIETWMKSCPVIITHYESYFYKPEEELQRLLNFIGIKKSRENIEELCKNAVKPGFYRGMFSDSVLQKYHDTPSGVEETYNNFCKLSGPIYSELKINSSYQTQKLENVEPILIKTSTEYFDKFSRDWNFLETEKHEIEKENIYLKGMNQGLEDIKNKLLTINDKLDSNAKELRKELNANNQRYQELVTHPAIKYIVKLINFSKKLRNKQGLNINNKTDPEEEI